MAAKIEVQPRTVGQNLVRLSGLVKEKAHEVRLTPPEGRGDPLSDVIISDKEGNGSVTLFLYAPGHWSIEARLSSADKDPVAAVECDV